MDQDPLVDKETSISEGLDFIKISNGKLIFDSFASFRNMLEDDALMEDFYQETSLLRVNSSDKYFRLASFDDDDSFEFLDQLLDQNKMVSIGDYTFRIDLPSESVYVVPFGSPLENSLIQEDYAAKGVMKFSTDDDVLDLLEEGYTSSPQTANLAILCGGGCGSSNLSTPVAPFLAHPNHYWTRVRYVKAGIYFELSYHFYMYWQIYPGIVPGNEPFSRHWATYRGNCRRSNLTDHKDNDTRKLMKLKKVTYGKNSWDTWGEANYKTALWTRSEGLQRISLVVDFDVPNFQISARSRTISCNNN
jgi:hypothetical protein